MNTTGTTTYTAFEGTDRIVRGGLDVIAGEVKRRYDREGAGSILVFDDATAEQIDLNLAGTLEDVVARHASLPVPAEPVEETGSAAPAPRGPGRPRLGVVAREITLLPRHWDWLGSQPGGASVAIRRLVDEARKASAETDRARAATDRAYRFMTAIAGNLPGYEEAIRALYRNDVDRLEEQVRDWPADVKEYLLELRRPEAKA